MVVFHHGCNLEKWNVAPTIYTSFADIMWGLPNIMANKLKKEATIANWE
jgi:hypothetical protein